MTFVSVDAAAAAAAASADVHEDLAYHAGTQRCYCQSFAEAALPPPLPPSLAPCHCPPHTLPPPPETFRHIPLLHVAAPAAASARAAAAPASPPPAAIPHASRINLGRTHTTIHTAASPQKHPTSPRWPSRRHSFSCGCLAPSRICIQRAWRRRRRLP